MKRKSRVLVSFVVIVTILLTILSFNFTSYAANSKEVTIRIFNPGVPKGSEQDAINKDIMDKFEKQYGYRIKWDYSSSDYATAINTLNLKLASGELDAFTSGGWGNNTSIMINKPGLLMPLNNLIKTDGKDITKYFKKYSSMSIFDGVTIKGNIMAIPIPNQVFTWSALWIRKDLVDKVGMKMPTTFKEYEKVLYAIRKKFPDIVPVTGDGIGNLVNEMLGEMAPASDVDKSGNLVPAYNSGNFYIYPTNPGYKTWLKTMQKWYKDGILNKQWFVWKTDKTLDVAKQGKLASVAWGGWNINQFVDNKNMNWQALYDLKATNGKPLGWGYGPVPKGIFGITANSKVGKEMIQYINWMAASPANSEMTNLGTRGMLTDWDEKGHYTLKKDFQPTMYAADLNFQVTLYPKEMTLLQKLNPKDPWNCVIYPEQQNIKGHARRTPIDQSILYNFPTKISSKFNDYNTLIDQTLQKIIMGSAPVSEVDNLVKKLNTKGFKTYLTEKNKQFKAFNKK